jgi:tetratricopeptide (TPR) repeat protein
VHADLTEYDQAKRCCEKAIKLDETWTYPWNGLGIVYSALKQYVKAKECYEKANELDPDDPTSQFNLGLLLFEQRKYSEAQVNLQIAQAGYQKAEYNNEYWLARTQDLLGEIKERLDSEKPATQAKPSSCPMMEVLPDNRAMKLSGEAEENQRSFRHFLDEPLDHEKDASEDYLLMLRRWNSYTPIIADNFHIGKGGGYFLKVKGKGIVIDPGFNFIDNFRGAGGLFHEIDAVLVSHAHDVYTADLEAILTLLEEYNEEIKDSSDPKKKTIRRELAENKKPPVAPEDITQEELYQAFLESPRRKIIHFYLTASVFKKYGGLFDLVSQNTYCLHTVEPKDSKDLFGGVKNGGIKIKFLKSNYNNIISDPNSVGLNIEFPPDLVLSYPADTTWNHDIEQQYK